MTLKRLTPVIQRRNLGYVQFWRDELVEIVRLMRQLDGADVRIEADDYLIEDIDIDLPQVSSRLSSFEATASREVNRSSSTRDLMKVSLSRYNCQIEATDPDLMTLGAIDAINSLADRRRRMPRRLMRAYRSSAGLGWNRFLIFSFGSAAFIFGISFIASSEIVRAFTRPSASAPTPVVIALGAAVGLVYVGMLIGYSRAKTILFTGTRTEAPTWWQKHRADIAINLVVGILFYLLGILTTHP
jgi:hypothetical protein